MNAATLKSLSALPHRLLPDGHGGYAPSICLANDKPTLKLGTGDRPDDALPLKDLADATLEALLADPALSEWEDAIQAELDSRGGSEAGEEIAASFSSRVSSDSFVRSCEKASREARKAAGR